MKKLILMLMASLFITATYAQETKAEKARRLLNIKEKTPTPIPVTRPVVVTRTAPATVLQETKAERARRLLKIKNEKTVVVPATRTVVVPATRTVVVPVNQAGKRKFHHDNGKHLGWYKNGKNGQGENHDNGNHKQGKKK